MKRIIFAFATAALLGVTGIAQASGPGDQNGDQNGYQNGHRDSEAQRVLRNYRIDRNVAELSTHQKDAIILIAHSGPDGGKRAQLLSALNAGLFSHHFRR